MGFLSTASATLIHLPARPPARPQLPTPPHSCHILLKGKAPWVQPQVPPAQGAARGPRRARRRTRPRPAALACHRATAAGCLPAPAAASASVQPTRHRRHAAQVGSRDEQCQEYPELSIEAWHKKHGLWVE